LVVIAFNLSPRPNLLQRKSQIKLDGDAACYFWNRKAVIDRAPALRIEHALDVAR
jgi:hypothetical protein